MEWISVEKQIPKKEKYYRCLCKHFTKPIKCKFIKAKNGPTEWYPQLFIYKKRIPFVLYWKE